MEILIYLGAFLLVMVAIAHSYLGERYILIRLFRRDDLPKVLGSDEFTKKTLRFAWHVTSIAWLGFAAILLVTVQSTFSKEVIGQIIALTFFIHFLIALFGSKGRHLSWIVFLAISVLALLGT
ncbi:hypothetical protein [Vibrio penaeicida]|uniref:DUF3325 domain-containing protein n=1 Tax=Vibrio penaeicida TaxID=104609 RepID=A0AAV5NKC3_9VIBR|nr:hypothetical protein [Vibrio penaeicida]RTZ23905.1 hypothetical protein EKN09_06485 [Vibrio penaeicida]GLQ70643.1 hypothetical protein GCM10007932_00030 [Vibrio penaeicida]